jgi:acetyl-CoA acetyltransferase family protein
MGITAEHVAKRWGVTRADQELFATESQRKAAAAVEAHAFDAEITPITLADGTVVAADGCLRPQTTPEALAKLKLAFAEDGTVTAGTASPLTDGTAMVIVANEAFIRRHQLQPYARIRSTAVAGVAPEVMGIGPVPASRKALARAGLRASDIDLTEINEAFASHACVSSASTLRRSTWMAVRSRSVIHSVRLARASPARPRACCGAPAVATPSRRNASAAARASRPCSKESEPKARS